MKKVIGLLLAVMLSLSLFGCSSKEDQAEKVVTQFLTALDNGDLAKAATYVDSDVTEGLLNLAQKFYDGNESVSTISTTVNFSDESIANWAKFISQLTAGIVEGYSNVTSEKVSDTQYNVSAVVNVKTGTKLIDSMNKVDTAELISSLATELTSLMASDQEKAYVWLYNKIIAFYLEKASEIIQNAEAEEKTITFKVEKKNSGWMITGSDY